MKNLSHEFLQSDIDTFIFTLELFLSTDMSEYTSEAQQLINESCSYSAIEKLLTHNTEFHPNEIRVMATSLICADMVLKGTLSASDDTRKRCSEYCFSINRLLPIFHSIFD